MQAVCWTPLYVKGKTQVWPVVVLHVGDAVVGGAAEVVEHVAVADRGLAEQVELAKGQQHDPDEVVVPTLWQWLGKEF